MAAKKQVDTAVAKSQKVDLVKSQKVYQAKTMDAIEVMGARVHNLKNVSVAFPRGKFIVVTGVSGSGKSSLTIDTLFAEGQRRYAESLSAYARQFMARMEKPDVDMIKGLCPAIAVEQKVITRTPRSTVGSMTEIYDYLRLLFARAGKTISPVSGKEVKKDEVSDVVAAICALPKNSKVVIGVALKQHKNRAVLEELGILLQKGFTRIYVAAAPEPLMRIEELMEQTPAALKKILPLAKSTSATETIPQTWVLIDRIVVKDFDEDDMHRLSDSVQTAFYEGEGEVYIEVDAKKCIILVAVLNLTVLCLKSPCLIYFLLIIHLAPVLLAKGLVRC